MTVLKSKYDLFTRNQPEAFLEFHWSEGKHTPATKDTGSYVAHARVRRAGYKAVYDYWSTFRRDSGYLEPLPVPTPKNLVNCTRRVFPLSGGLGWRSCTPSEGPCVTSSCLLCHLKVPVVKDEREKAVSVLPLFPVPCFSTLH